MAAVIETWFNQDLQNPVQVHYLDGNLFSNNGNGNLIGVNVTSGGAEVTLSGTVSGYAVLSDGTTVPCTGSKSGNKASILIPPAAYLPGSIFITIFLTDSNTVTTIAALSSTVMRARTDSQVDPGTVVTDWTQTINAAMQEVETAAEGIETAAANLGHIVATPYAQLTFPVPLGKYTYYNNNVYRCTTPIPSSEDFTAAHWSAAINLGDELRTEVAARENADTALQSAIGELKSAINYRTDNTAYNDNTPTGMIISTTNRWFLEGFAYGVVDSVSIRFKSAGSAVIEIWEKDEEVLTRIDSRSVSCATNYTWKTFKIGVSSEYPMMISIISNTSDSIYCIIDTSTNFNGRYTSDKTSTILTYSKLDTYTGLNVTAYATYCTTYATPVPGLERNKASITDISRIFAIPEKSVYNTGTLSGTVISNSNRWFLNGTMNGIIKNVTIRCKKANSPVKIEIWELSGNTLTRVIEKNVTSYIAYDWNVFEIEYIAEKPIMVSVCPSDGDNIYQNTDVNSGYNAYRTTDLSSITLSLSSLLTFSGLCVLGYVTYMYGGFASTRIVSKNGNGGYRTIADAVNVANDGDVIIVYPGTYTEPVEAWGKTISIIGVDKHTCIIENDTGNYSTPAVEIDSGRISGFTILSTGANPTCDQSDTNNYMKDYSIHVDYAHAEERTLIIEDCIIRNNHRTALGMGCYKNNTVVVRNCDLWADAPPSTISNPLWNKRGVLYFHNRAPSDYFSNVTGQKMRFISNTMYCEDIIAIYIGDTCDGIDMEAHGWINEMEVEFINNMICAKYANGNYKTSSNGVATPTEFTNDSIVGGTGFTDHLKLSGISYGNNVEYLNAN